MKIPCSMIQEVVPNYIDGCCSEEARDLVDEHLQTCESCQRLLDDMKQPMDYHHVEEIDYLKKVRKKNYWKMAFVLFLTTSVWFVFMFVKTYVMPESVETIVVSDIIVKENKIEFLAYSPSNDTKVDGFDIVENKTDRQTLKFKIMNVKPNSGGVAMAYKIALNDIDTYIEIGDKIIDKKGNIFDKVVSDFVDNRIPYVGDNSAVSKLLGFSEFNKMGSYKFQLYSDAQENAIHILFDKPISPIFQSMMKRNAKAVLASIDNCNKMIIYDGNNYDLSVTYDEKIYDYAQMQALLMEE